MGFFPGSKTLVLGHKMSPVKQGEVDPVIKLYGGTTAAETLVSKVQTPKRLMFQELILGTIAVR